jgi:hypothetical protein
VVERRN